MKNSNGNKPKILLLSYAIKDKLAKLSISKELVIDPVSTDLEFLHIIREYLAESGRILDFHVIIAERDDLEALNGCLIVSGARKVVLQRRDRIGYPSSIIDGERMNRQFGDHTYYCPFELHKVVNSSEIVDSFIVDPSTDMIFEYSDDDPVECRHEKEYELLCELFNKGRVQTNPYFPFKKACASEYGFDSSKNIAYHLCDGLPIVIPGVITSDSDIALRKLNEFKSVVLKVQDGTGGNGVSFFSVNDDDRNGITSHNDFVALFESMLLEQNEQDERLGLNKRGIVVQKFLPDIKERGDTRVHIINGKVCLIAQKRIPAGSSKLANLSAGGTFETKVLDDAEIEVAVQVAQQFQLHVPAVISSHIGIDLLKSDSNDGEGNIVPLVSEVNTWGIRLISETIDFFMNHEKSSRSHSLYLQYRLKLLQFRGTESERFILQNEDILYELVGRFLK